MSSLQAMKPLSLSRRTYMKGSSFGPPSRSLVAATKSDEADAETIARFQGAFPEMEVLAVSILDDLVSVLSPRWMKVESAFNSRGGMTETVTVQYAAVV